MRSRDRGCVRNKLNQALLWAVSHQLACMIPSVYTQSFLNQRIDVSLIAQKLRYFPKTRAYVSWTQPWKDEFSHTIFTAVFRISRLRQAWLFLPFARYSYKFRWGRGHCCCHRRISTSSQRHPWQQCAHSAPKGCRQWWLEMSMSAEVPNTHLLIWALETKPICFDHTWLWPIHKPPCHPLYLPLVLQVFLHHSTKCGMESTAAGKTWHKIPGGLSMPLRICTCASYNKHWVSQSKYVQENQSRCSSKIQRFCHTYR